MLKLSCFLLGKPFGLMEYQSFQYHNKIQQYAILVILITMLWGVNGYLLGSYILERSVGSSIFLSVFSAVIIYVVERSIINSNSMSWKLKLLRLTLALSSALIGSLIVDEVLFKPEIESELHKVAEGKAEADNSVKIASAELKELINQKSSISNQVEVYRKIATEESNTKVGPITKFKQSQVDALVQKEEKLEKQISKAKIELQKTTNLAISNNMDTGIIHNINALIKVCNSNNKVGRWVWLIFFLIFFSIELLPLVIKMSQNGEEEIEIINPQNLRLRQWYSTYKLYHS